MCYTFYSLYVHLWLYHFSVFTYYFMDIFDAIFILRIPSKINYFVKFELVVYCTFNNKICSILFCEKEYHATNYINMSSNTLL